MLVLLYGCEIKKKNIEFWNLFCEIDTKGDLFNEGKMIAFFV